MFTVIELQEYRFMATDKDKTRADIDWILTGLGAALS
jgi:hypothetical protein